MTKQEEIRDKLVDFILFAERQGVGTIERTKSLANQADEILSYLHSQGLMIKADRELPTYWMGEEMPYRMRNMMIEDGCGFFEPLIKE